MTRLAQRHDAVNLGQGFPDFDGPDFLHEAAVRAIRGGQEPVRPDRRRAGARPRRSCRHQERFWGLDYAPDEITVYAGATEAIFASLQALCDPGDEVVLFEPFYDSYRRRSPWPAPASAGGDACDRSPERPEPGVAFGYDPAELEAAIGPRTRAILLNTPHNPTGKVWNRERARAPRRRSAGEHDLLADLRRGLRAPGLRGRARAAGHPARHARAHGDHLLGRQDLQRHRLEDRLDLRAAGAHPGAPGGAPVHHLLQRHPVPARGRPRPRRRGRLLRRVPRRATGRAAIACAPGSRRSASGSTGRRAPTSCSPTSARSDGDDDVGLLPYAAGDGRRGGDPAHARSTSTRRRAGTWCASPSARPTRCSTRRSGACGGSRCLSRRARLRAPSIRRSGAPRRHPTRRESARESRRRCRPTSSGRTPRPTTPASSPGCAPPSRPAPTSSCCPRCSPAASR